MARHELATPLRVAVATKPRPAHVTEPVELALEADHVSYLYGKHRALDDISFGVPARRVTALIGPSGCGKSTLLRSFNRMNDEIPGGRLEGTVRYFGTDLYGPGVEPLAVRRQIGMVFQRPNPFPKSVYDNVAFGVRASGLRKGALDDVVEEALRQVALWDDVRGQLRASALSLSGGQQQRVCIARAIAVQPSVLLMDEPCSALDPIATLKIEELITSLRDRYTIVVVTHNLQQAARVSDRTAFLTAEVSATGSRTGVLVEEGPTAQIFGNPRDSRTDDYISGRFG